MSGVVKFTEASTIAMHAMAILAARAGHHVSVHELGELLPVSENTVAKVMQRLARADLVESVRGPGGGFVLRGDPSKMTLLEVHEAIDGPLHVASCMFSPPQCCGTCILGDALHQANALMHARLSKTRLSELAHLFAERTALVALGATPPTSAPRARRTGAAATRARDRGRA
jgi:Rrf2 family protein